MAPQLSENVSTELQKVSALATTENLTRIETEIQEGRVGVNLHFAFGTDDSIETTPGYVLVKHSTLGCKTPASTPEAGMEVHLPCAKVLGGSRGRLAQTIPLLTA